MKVCDHELCHAINDGMCHENGDGTFNLSATHISKLVGADPEQMAKSIEERLADPTLTPGQRANFESLRKNLLRSVGIDPNVDQSNEEKPKPN